MSTAGSAIQGAQHGHSAPILDLRADLHPNEPHSGPPRLLRTAGVPLGHPLDPPSMACGRGSSDRRSLADSVELPVAAPRASGLAHGLTGQHSLDLPAPSGGLFALRRRYEPQRLSVHQNGTTPAQAMRLALPGLSLANQFYTAAIAERAGGPPHLGALPGAGAAEQLIAAPSPNGGGRPEGKD